MLDWAHRLTLRAVAAGDFDDSPALRTLAACGLVEQQADGSYIVTPAGHVALRDDEPERWERIVWPVGCLIAAGYAVSTVIDWVS